MSYNFFQALGRASRQKVLYVKLQTSVYKRGERRVLEKSLTPLKRKSTLKFEEIVDWLEEDLPRIIGIDTLSDGIYELTATNFSRDFETGMIDDWDLVLIPTTETKNEKSNTLRIG